MIPTGGRMIAAFHGHGDSGWLGERFSGQPGDKNQGGDIARQPIVNIPLGLATAGGRVMIYYPNRNCQIFYGGFPIGSGTTVPICH